MYRILRFQYARYSFYTLLGAVFTFIFSYNYITRLNISLNFYFQTNSTVTLPKPSPSITTVSPRFKNLAISSSLVL